MAKILVSVYFSDRKYGGPEEGGWYYEAGELCRTMRAFHTEGQAINYARRLAKRLDVTLNRGRRSMGSVLSTGRYVVRWDENVAPLSYPAERPFYE